MSDSKVAWAELAFWVVWWATVLVTAVLFGIALWVGGPLEGR